jgi:hypothetical protein
MSLLQNSNAIQTAGGYDINNSLRFRSSASAYLNRTPASAGNRQVMTYSFWVKRGGLAADSNITNATTDASNSATLYFNNSNSGSFDVFLRVGGTNYSVSTTQVFRDPSAWYHIIVAIDTTQATSSNRTKVYVNGTQVTAFAAANYVPQNSNLAFNNNVAQYIGFSNYFDGYMAEVNFVDGQALTPSSFGETDTDTGVWKPKAYTGTYGTNGFYLPFSDPSVNTQNLLTYSEDATNAAWNKVNITDTANTIAAPNGTTTADSILETTANSFHVLLPTASTAVAASTVYTASVYVKSINNQFIQLVLDDTATTNGGYANYDLTNGTVTQSANYGTATGLATSITSVGSGWYRITLSTTIGANTTARYAINGIQSGTSGTFPNYLGNASNGYYVWGMQLNQGSTVSPYVYTAATAQSTIVNNLGRDYSVTTGGYNNWIPTNISVTAGTTYDAMIDSPTLTSETVANYPVINPFKPMNSPTISNGNLQLSIAGSDSASSSCVSTIAIPTTGKWYAEFSAVTLGALSVGIFSEAAFSANRAAYYRYSTGGIVKTGASVATVATSTVSDIIAVAVDRDSDIVYFYKNGSLLYTLTSAALPSMVYYGFEQGSSGGSCTGVINFGQRPFAYTPPTGFIALNTYNLPDSTIVKGNTVMDATLYTGTGSTLTVTNAGSMKSDLLWIKSRSAATDNYLFDSRRGEGGILISNSTAAETVLGSQMSFNSNGFTVGSLAAMNTNGATYVGWQWQAGQGSTSSNTDGSITSTVSANTTAGFSIVTYTGVGAARTIGHGLGVAPRMILVKSRTGTATTWAVYHANLTSAANYLSLESTAAQASGSTVWNNTAPTSSVFSVGSASGTGSTRDYVAYCWAEIAGFSKFGSYTGNGSANGPFIYTGFRPTFIIVKRSNSTGDWYIWDTARNTYNVVNSILLPNSSAAETTATSIDILSNGFRLRNTTTGFNASGSTYIYAAFAENPFKNSLAR